MQEFYHITWTDVFVSLVLVGLTLALIRWWKIGLEKTLIIGTVRSFVQLTFMGYVLTFFFEQRHWSFMIGLIVVMTLIAGFEGARRQKKTPIPNYFLILTGSLFTTLVIVLGVILAFILDVKPWYYPYAIIPIGGMIIGNAMNSATLATNRFMSELQHRRGEIEMMLSLGSPVRAAVQDSIRESVQAALIPTINSMMTVGIVFLPGIMSGQILSGVDPLIAVRYQIMIMYMWVTTTALADILVLALVYRQLFTSKAQLKQVNVRR